jgi:hypothetical protein
MSGNIVVSIPPIHNNPIWFNNFVVSIFYSQYSKALLIRDNKTGNGINDYIYDAYMNNDNREFNEIKIKNIINDVFDFNKKLREILKYIKIEYNLYEYYLKNKQIFTSFVLPKFIYYLGLTSISIEHYNEKNYVGLYDLVKYNSHKIIKKKTGFFAYGKQEISEYRLELDTTKKQNYIRKLYNRAIHPDYITVNKWFGDNNIPLILSDIEKMNGSIDDDDFDNIYRLSTTYKNKDDLKIDNTLQTELIYNEYKYTLDSCIINNYNDDFIDDDDEEEYEEKENIVCLNNNDNKIIYSGSHIPQQLCTKIYKFDWVNKNKFQIYSGFPCNIFEGNSNGIPDEDLSLFDITKSNYTLIYVKHEKSIKEEIADEKNKDKLNTAEKTQKDKKEKEEREKKDKEEEEKRKKYAQLDELKILVKDQEEKLKTTANKEDIEKITKIAENCTPSAKAEKDLIRDCTDLLKEYIKLLKYDESDIKTYTISDYIHKTSDIIDIINKAKLLYEEKKKPAAIKSAIAANQDNFLKYYENIIKYLEAYVYHIINILSRHNIIKLLKDELKDVSKDIRVVQILESISKLPNADNFKKIEELLTPTDANIAKILEAISKLPNDAKLKKIEDLLKPTDEKIAQILATIEKMSKDDKMKEILDAISKMPKNDNTKLITDAISKLPNEAKINDLFKALIKDLPKADNTREILDAISKMPKEDNKKLLQDLNAKIDAMQQDLLSKIQEQKSTNSRTIQPEIAELRRQLQLMGDIQKQLSEATKNDHTKIIETLNSKLDDMQQILMDKLQNMEIKKSSSSNDKITLQSEIASLNQQLKLLEDIQTKIAQSGERDNKQLLQDMQQELLKYSEKDNQKIISGVQDLLRLFNKEIVLKQNEKDVMVHQELERNIKEQLVLLKDIQSKLENGDGNNSNCKNENNLLKLENTELKQQIEILKDIQSKCKRQQQDYEKCNKHNMLPYKYIKFKEDELLAAIKDNFNGKGKQSDKIIIEFIFKYFEKNNKVMNVYLIEKYMGDIYDVMKIFNKKYNIDDVDIKQFYRLLASISIYAKFNEAIKKNIY